jgi:hypothetical protein
MKDPLYEYCDHPQALPLSLTLDVKLASNLAMAAPDVWSESGGVSNQQDMDQIHNEKWLVPEPQNGWPSGADEATPGPVLIAGWLVGAPLLTESALAALQGSMWACRLASEPLCARSSTPKHQSDVMARFPINASTGKGALSSKSVDNNTNIKWQLQCAGTAVSLSTPHCRQVSGTGLRLTGTRTRRMSINP